MVSSSHIISAAPSSSGGRLLILFPCSNMRSVSQETVLHKILQRESFPQTAVLHELPQHESSPWGAVLQEQPAPAWVSMGSQALPADLLWCGLLSPRVHRSWQEPAPARAPHGVTASFRRLPAPVWGPFHGLQMDICSTMDLRGLQGDSVPHHGLQHKLQGKTLLRHLERLLPLPSSLTLGFAELFLSHGLAPLSQLLSHCRFFSSPS